MRIKTSEYTVYLAIGALIIIIINQFYNPLGLVNVLEMMKADNPEDFKNVPVWLLTLLGQIFVPVIMAQLDLFSYVITAEMNFNNMADIVSALLLIAGYIVIVYILERIHVEWHENESVLTMCIDMMCIEIIAMFLFEFVFSIIIWLIHHMGIPDLVWGIIAFIVVLPIVYAFFCYFVYLVVGEIVSLFVPAMLTIFLSSIIGGFAFLLLPFSLLFFARYLWVLISDKVYAFLIDWFSFHRISLT